MQQFLRWLRWSTLGGGTGTGLITTELDRLPYYWSYVENVRTLNVFWPPPPADCLSWVKNVRTLNIFWHENVEKPLYVWHKSLLILCGKSEDPKHILTYTSSSSSSNVKKVRTLNIFWHENVEKPLYVWHFSPQNPEVVDTGGGTGTGLTRTDLVVCLITHHMSKKWGP